MKFSLVLLSVAASALANVAHPNVKRDHHAHAAAALHKKDAIPEDLVKRDSYTGQATYYEVQTGNAGACGQNEYDSQAVSGMRCAGDKYPVLTDIPKNKVVALNTPQLQAYGGYVNGIPASCFQSITIQANGVTAQATIMDECPTCGWGSLDLSPSLFQQFASLDAGVFPITWWFNDGSGGGGAQPTTSQYTPPPYTPPPYTPPPPTTTYTPPPPTTTSTPPPPPTTSSTPPPPSTTSTTSSSTSSSESSSSQEVTTTTPQNLVDVNMAAVKMAAFIHAAAGA